MPRRLVFVVLLLSMLTQAVMLGGRWPDANGAGAVHTLLHWAGLAHHHHHQPAPSREDLEGFEAFGNLGAPDTAARAGSDTYHQDQSTDSTQHVAMDACLSGMALFTSWPRALPTTQPCSVLPLARAEAARATPFLEGLQRPPKSIA